MEKHDNDVKSIKKVPDVINELPQRVAIPVFVKQFYSSIRPAALEGSSSSNQPERLIF
jgi:hypothetical protein